MSIIHPALNLVARPGVLPPQATFTRASTATRINALGKIESVAAGLLRHDYDPLTGEYLGWLIEEARTNLALDSADIGGAFDAKNVTVTADSVIAPDGSSNGNKIEDTSTVAVQEVNQAITVADDGVTYTGSIFLRAGTIGEDIGLRLALSGGTGVTVDLTANLSTGAITSGSGSIKSHGSGWYRVSFSIANNSSGNTVLTFRLYPGNTAAATGHIYAWGRQLEAGAFPTSYIPTAAATATRTADVMTVATAGLVNAAEGTLYVSGDVGQISGAPPLAALLTDADNQIQLYLSGAAVTAHVVTGAVIQASISAGTVAERTAIKFAVAYEVNDFAACLNAGTVETNISGTVPAVTTLELGSAPSAGTLNGHLRHVACFPRRLSNADLQTITG